MCRVFLFPSLLAAMFLVPADTWVWVGTCGLWRSYCGWEPWDLFFGLGLSEPSRVFSFFQKPLIFFFLTISLFLLENCSSFNHGTLVVWMAHDSGLAHRGILSFSNHTDWFKDSHMTQVMLECLMSLMFRCYLLGLIENNVIQIYLQLSFLISWRKIQAMRI